MIGHSADAVLIPGDVHETILWKPNCPAKPTPVVDQQDSVSTEAVAAPPYLEQSVLYSYFVKVCCRF